MNNVQARLLAASLALIAGAILFASRPDEPFLRSGVLIIAAVLFVVEYVRTQLPGGEVRT
jgi:uncharacterized membrane protein YgaE (UPF0421/DUF939 family)